MPAAHTLYRGLLALLLLSPAANIAWGQGFGNFGIRVGGQNFQVGGSGIQRVAPQPRRGGPQVGFPAGSLRLPSEFGRAVESFVPRAAADPIRQITSQPPYGDQRYRPNPNGRLDLSNFRIEHAAALAVAVTARGRLRECENPFCATPPAPCPPSVPVTYTPEQYFEQAQQAFRYGQYERALDLITRAQTLLPDEPDLFQFRSLILFASGDYVASAAAAYTALSTGPGWNWDTLYGFYGDTGRYTQHLRELEAATKSNPDSAEHHFLHGYHCLMLGHLEAGRKRLERVLEIEKDEPLTKALLEMLPE